MKKRFLLFRIFLLWGVFLLLPSLLGAETPVGRIVYLEGIVDVHRNGQIVELFESDLGMDLYNQDLIKTGEDGILTLEITAFRNSGTNVTVAENTAFFFDTSGPAGGHKAELAMLAGSLSFKVQKLSGTEELRVRTTSAAMGVRGTEFEVVTAPEGSILVVCVEGQVLCEDDQRGQQYARAGRLVEKRSGESIRRIDVEEGDEKLYREFWVNQREQVFKAGAPTFVKAYSQQYLTLLPQFSEAYQRVLSHRETLLRHGQAEVSGSGVNGDLLMIYKDVSKDLIPSRGIFVLFEQVFYSVKVLQRYHSQGLGRTRINSSLTSQEFFNNYNSYEPVLVSQLANMHYFYKLFANLAASASPAGGMLGDIFSSGNNPMGSGGSPSGSVPSSSF